jgi:hypothetical protein
MRYTLFAQRSHKSRIHSKRFTFRSYFLGILFGLIELSEPLSLRLSSLHFIKSLLISIRYNGYNAINITNFKRY